MNETYDPRELMFSRYLVALVSASRSGDYTLYRDAQEQFLDPLQKGSSHRLVRTAVDFIEALLDYLDENDLDGDSALQSIAQYVAAQEVGLSTNPGSPEGTE